MIKWRNWFWPWRQSSPDDKRVVCHEKNVNCNVEEGTCLDLVSLAECLW